MKIARLVYMNQSSWFLLYVLIVKQIDEVEAYIIVELMVDKKTGEPVTLECSYCDGEMFEEKNDKSD